jgi:hypothetical protein
MKTNMAAQQDTFHTPFNSTDTRARIDWKSFVDVIPAGLELMSTASIMRQAFELVSNATDARRYAAALGDTQATLRAASVPLLILERRGGHSLISTSSMTQPQRRGLGQLALQLYFAQLFRCEAALIDLWSSRFGIDEAGDAIWAPRPMYVQWEPVFLGAVRDVYAGFFADDNVLFRSGLDRLGLGAAGAVLLRHLGEGNQRSVRFSETGLQSTLRDIVALRSSRQPSLHRNFVAFGLYLASLHELLASLDLAFDVRAAFMQAQPKLASDV